MFVHLFVAVVVAVGVATLTVLRCSCHTSWTGDDCSTRYVVHGVLLDDGYVHVGGTRGVTWSIDRIVQIQLYKYRLV